MPSFLLQIVSLMGERVEVFSNEVLPSQDFLKEKTVKHIMECILNNKQDELPPTPIVRKNPHGTGFIAIDGHNLIAVYDLLGERFEVFVAENSLDKLENLVETESLKKRNRDLAEKFDSAILEAERLEKEGICSFSDLRKKYAWMKDLTTLKNHFNL